jgi:hypothetical protein
MSKKNPAGYVALNECRELAERIDRAFDLLRSCRVHSVVSRLFSS